MLDFIALWADWIITACNLGLSVGVVPMLWQGRRQQHVPYATSVTFVVLLAGLAVAMLSQELVLSAASDAFAVALWAGVAGERWWQGRARITVRTQR